MIVSARVAPRELRDIHILRLGDRDTLRDSHDLTSLLRTIAAASRDLEALILRTDTHTEFYLAGARSTGVIPTTVDTLRRALSAVYTDGGELASTELSGTDAATHLFRLACGLEEAVPNPSRSVACIREAFHAALRCGTIGETLTEAFATAMRAGERARTHQPRGSNPTIGLTVARRVIADLPWDQLHRLCVLIVGAGAMARDVARHLSALGVSELMFVNRTRARAERLALDFGGVAPGWTCLRSALFDAHVVVTATSATEYVLPRTLLDHVAFLKLAHSPLIIDVGNPPNVEPGGAFPVVSLEDVVGVHQQDLDAQHGALLATERIVTDALEEWRERRSHGSVAPQPILVRRPIPDRTSGRFHAA